MMAKAGIDKLLGRAGRKSHSSAPCSIIDEDDLTNDDRVTKCSSINTCYNKRHSKYDSGNCNGWESCGMWVSEGSTKQGCIISKYCNVTANYVHGPVHFECPSGMKEAPLFDVDSLGRKIDFGKDLDAEIQNHYKELTIKMAKAMEAKAKLEENKRYAEEKIKEA